MKTYVLMVAKTFPATHSRKGDLTRFAYFIAKGIKIHTIRGNYALWAARISEIKADRAVLSVREWTGKPYKSKQNILFDTTDVDIQLVERKENGELYIDGKFQEVATVGNYIRVRPNRQNNNAYFIISYV